MPTYNGRSSFTAHGVAYRRTFTNIPFSQEIFQILQDINPMSPAEIEQAMNWNLLPFFEARYLMSNRQIALRGIRQVYELAAGLSPRGIAMTEDPGCTFVELDLFREKRLKWEIVQRLIDASVIPSRKNFHLVAGSVTTNTVRRVADDFFRREEPVAVVCEGLLRYLSFDDQKILATNIFRILRRFGGVWITPDVEVKQHEFSVPGQRERYEKMAQQTGVDVQDNLFQDMAAMFAFFKGLGFSVEVVPLISIAGELSSPARLGFDPSETERILENRPTLILTIPS